MRYSRRKFTEQFIDFTDRIHIGDTKAFYFDISAEDVILFLLKQTYKSLIFFLRLRICLAGSAQQAQQSTYLAEGRRKRKKIMQAAKKLLTSTKEKGPLGKKSPFTRILLPFHDKQPQRPLAMFGSLA